MTRFIERHPAWALILLIAVAVMLWLILAVWPPGLEEAIGRKRVFLNAVFNGITLGSLYFLVASGFTLIFGLMRNVNLAHGSLYLFGGYIGYAISIWTGSWILGFIIAFLGVALLGIVLQIVGRGGLSALPDGAARDLRSRRGDRHRDVAGAQSDPRRNDGARRCR